MKNKLIATAALSILLASGNSYAGSYTCNAKSNPSRGFNFAFQISIDSTSIGGHIFMLSDGRQMNLGTISESGLLRKSNPAEKAAFDAALGLISEKDVSGINESDLDKVEKIQVYRSGASDGDETLVYQLFDQRKQIGGSILISGMGTACLP